MHWNDWEPWYREIVAGLGLDPARDMESARLLETLIAPGKDDAIILERLLGGREAVVFGPAPFSPEDFGDAVLISAGSATGQAMFMNILPDIVVTDLDGDIGAQVEASRKGAVTVIHAHGDNMDAIREWVPRIQPPVIGTTQGEPFGRIHNFGGFTDGDRAVFLAMHFGVSRIMLRGFNLDSPVGSTTSGIEAKRKKLMYARRLIEHAEDTSGAEILC